MCEKRKIKLVLRRPYVVVATVGIQDLQTPTHCATCVHYGVWLDGQGCCPRRVHRCLDTVLQENEYDTFHPRFLYKLPPREVHRLKYSYKTFSKKRSHEKQRQWFIRILKIATELTAVSHLWGDNFAALCVLHPRHVKGVGRRIDRIHKGLEYVADSDGKQKHSSMIRRVGSRDLQVNCRRRPVIITYKCVSELVIDGNTIEIQYSN